MSRLDTDSSIEAAKSRWRDQFEANRDKAKARLLDEYNRNVAAGVSNAKTIYDGTMHNISLTRDDIKALNAATPPDKFDQSPYFFVLSDFESYVGFEAWAVINHRLYWPMYYDCPGCRFSSHDFRDIVPDARRPYDATGFDFVWAVDLKDQSEKHDDANDVYGMDLKLVRIPHEGRVWPTHIFNPSTNKWEVHQQGFDEMTWLTQFWIVLGDLDASEMPGIDFPVSDTGLSASQMEAIETAVKNSSLPLVVPTDYIVIGDEVPGKMILDFEQMLKTSGTPDADNMIDNFKKLLGAMPRLMLKDWYNNNIRNQVDRDYQDAIWAAIVDLFNRVNVDLCKQQNLEPWDWEQKKLQNYYDSQNADKVAQLQAQLDDYTATFSDPRALEIMQEYKQLTPLGEIGFEISRQAAIKALIQRGEYDHAKGIIEAYKYMSYTEFADALAKPLAGNVAMPDGTVYTKST